MIEIDGSHGEGGGQLLRMAVALAALRGTDVRVTRIRAGRPHPGLAAQHVTAVRAVGELCAARVEGLELGASEIRFRPGAIAGGRHALDVGTAGSVTLVLQACLPVAFAADAVSRIRIVGGTDVRWSPPLDYFARVFLPWVRRLGGQAEVETIRRGYFPRGGGVVEATVHPCAGWSPLSLAAPGALRRIRGIAHASNLPEEIPRRMAHAALRRLHGQGEAKLEERVYTGDDAVGQGGAVVVWAETENAVLGSTALAEKGKSSERVGEEAASGLVADLASGATLDVHAADQVLPYLLLADGPSSFLVREPTEHLRTLGWLLPQFFERSIDIAPQGALWRVSVSARAA